MAERRSLEKLTDRHPWTLVIVAIAVAVAAGLAVYERLKPAPGVVAAGAVPPPAAPATAPASASTIAITSPRHEERATIRRLDDGAGQFEVRGTTTNLGAGESVYLLVHPVVPSAGWWYVQAPAVVSGDGSWIATGYIGNPKAPPRIGDVFAIAAMIKPSGTMSEGMQLSAPHALPTSAKTAVVTVTIGAFR